VSALSVAPVLAPVSAILVPVAAILQSVAPVLQPITLAAVVARVPPIFQTISAVLLAIAAILDAVKDVFDPVAIRLSLRVIRVGGSRRDCERDYHDRGTLEYAAHYGTLLGELRSVRQEAGVRV